MSATADRRCVVAIPVVVAMSVFVGAIDPIGLFPMLNDSSFEHGGEEEERER